MALKPKIEAFCLAYVRTLNSAQAARDAGYSVKTARTQGSKLLTKGDVIARVKDLTDEKFRALHMSADETIARVSMIARADVRKLYGPDGELKPVHELSDEAAAAVAGIETDELRNADGDIIGKVRKVKYRDPTQSLRMLAEYHRLLRAPDEGVDALANALADRLKSARMRRRQATKEK